MEDAFAEQITLTQSLGASDPQLVVVFEAIDERADLARVAKPAGLEILAEVEQEYEPDPNFPRKTANQDLPVTGCLHAVCINEQSRGKIPAQWRLWQATGQVDHGYAPLRDIFAHLKDVRPWGPQDRVRFSELAAALAGMLPGDHTIDIELWYRLSSPLRRRAQDEVARLIQASGGVFSEPARDGWHVRAIRAGRPAGRWAYAANSDGASTATGRAEHIATRTKVSGRKMRGESSLPESAPRRSRTAVLENLNHHTNVGAIFRSAAAIGVDAVLVSPQCADPLYRRSIRVSMGTVFQVPWTRIESWPDDIEVLKEAGYFVAGMSLGEGSITLDELVVQDHPNLALVFGTEGEGLRPETDRVLDARVTIPMMNGVDSLNVAASSAVAFYATG